MLVSFIIPAYNAADTIVRCLDSIYGLSLGREEFEVIVIDDASSDNTVEVVEQYCQKVYGVQCKVYDNFTLLKQPENRRQGAARNRGVKVAKGEYICFVDSDDAVAEGIVKAIWMAKERNAEMMAFHHAFVNKKGVITKEADKLSFEEGDVFSGIVMQNKHPYWCSGPVAYIYNRKFMEQVNYPFCEGVLYEDSDFVATHLYYAKKMSYSAALGYLVYYREGSTTHSMTHKNVADYLLLGTRMLRLYERIKSERVSELMNEREKYAEGILEGACWNVCRACKNMIKLRDLKEVIACYDRVDAHVNRAALRGEKKLQTYFWNAWTMLCLKHKKITVVMLAVIISLYKCVKNGRHARYKY